MNRTYEERAKSARKQVRISTNMGRFYLGLAALNVVVAMFIWYWGGVPLSFFIAVLMFVLWVLNRRTVQRWVETAETYERLDRW